MINFFSPPAPPPIPDHGISEKYLKVSNTQNPAFWAGVWNKDAGPDVTCEVSLDAVRKNFMTLGGSFLPLMGSAAYSMKTGAEKGLKRSF